MNDHKNKNSNSTLQLFTIGHSNMPEDKFIVLLKAYDIQVLVDIRSQPFSRRVPQFNKNVLKTLCETNGIKYLFLGNLLGGKPEDHNIYGYNEKVNYDRLAKADYFQQGVDQLFKGIKKNKICCMCSEGRPEKCHRYLLLAPSLEAKGVIVTHILPDSKCISNRNLILRINRGQLKLFEQGSTT